MRHTFGLALFLAAVTLLPSGRAEAANYILYFHGRDMAGWPGELLLQHQSGWTHWAFSYNGNQRLDHSTTRTSIKSAISTACNGSNSCVMFCFSAGCNRMLRGLAEQTAANMLWAVATASAAGGTELADPKLRNKASKWARIFNFVLAFSVVSGFTAIAWAAIQGTFTWYNMLYQVVKIGTDRIDLPAEQAIDKDLTPTVMRSNFGYIQNVAPAPVYHLAGTKNICQKIRVAFVLKFKFCGNDNMPGKYGDGAVPIHSAGGFSSANAYATCTATGAKYTNRQCEGASYAHNHSGMPAEGVKAGSVRLAMTSAAWTMDMNSDGGTLPDCNPIFDDCLGQWDTAQAMTTQIAGVLNATYAAALKANPKSWCFECDNSGISACRYFSIVAGYDPGDLAAWVCNTCLDKANVPRKCCTGLDKSGSVIRQYGYQHTYGANCVEKPICDKYGCKQVLSRNTGQYDEFGQLIWESCCWPVLSGYNIDHPLND